MNGNTPRPRPPAPSRGSSTGAPGAAPNTSILRLLTHTQNASAAVFGVFFTAHLAAPLAAAFGGLSAADNVMILGRELYLPLEAGLVYAPLALHVLAGAGRRALLTYKTRGRARVSNQAKAGWALLPLVLPHLWLHRVLPADAAAPINAMSPSEFGYEFVGHAAASRPWMTAGYLALSAFGVYHALVGGMQVAAWAKRLMGIRPRAKSVSFDEPEEITERRRGRLVKPIYTVVAGFVGIVGLGLFRMARDADGLSASTLARYRAVYASAPWAAILQ